MGVVGTVVNMEVADEATTETVFGEHTLDGTKIEGVHAGFDVLVERLLHQTFGSGFALTAGITGVAEVDLVGHLFAGKNDFVGVDDDDIVTTLEERSVRRFVFAAQQFGDFGAEAAENLVGGVNHNPFALGVCAGS